MSGANSHYNFVIGRAPWALARVPRARARRRTDARTHRMMAPSAVLRLLALQRSVERHADRDRAHRWSRSAAAPPLRSRVGGEGGFSEVCTRASTPLATPWAPILGGSPGCFQAFSGGSTPDGGLPEPTQGTPGHLHTSRVPVERCCSREAVRSASALRYPSH
jgi:hypothetical protein